MSDIPYFVCFIDAEYEIRWIRRGGGIVAVQPLRFDSSGSLQAEEQNQDELLATDEHEKSHEDH